jgi:hypothetical protein
MLANIRCADRRCTPLQSNQIQLRHWKAIGDSSHTGQNGQSPHSLEGIPMRYSLYLAEISAFATLGPTMWLPHP